MANTFRLFGGLGAYAPAIGFLVVVFLLWEALIPVLGIPRFLLPTPSQIFATYLVIQDAVWSHSLFTLYETALGFAAGAGIGILFGIAIAYSQRLERLIYPVAIAIKVTPVISIAPLLILWFDRPFGAIAHVIIIIAIIVFFPVLVNMAYGVKATDPELLDLMRSLSASGRQIFFKVRLPSSLPYLFASLKVAVTLALIGAVVGEWVRAQSGLGFLTISYQINFRTPEVFVVLGTLVLLGLGLFAIVAAVERVVAGWSGTVQPH